MSVNTLSRWKRRWMQHMLFSCYIASICSPSIILFANSAKLKNTLLHPFTIQPQFSQSIDCICFYKTTTSKAAHQLEVLRVVIPFWQLGCQEKWTQIRNYSIRRSWAYQFLSSCKLGPTRRWLHPWPRYHRNDSRDSPRDGGQYFYLHLWHLSYRCGNVVHLST